MPDAPTLDDWALCARWLCRAAEVVEGSAEALNALNVFPVADSDTGSNVRLTLAGILDAVRPLPRLDADALVSAAVLSAHGNSGAIVAEMITSACRLLAASERADPSGRDGRGLARLLRNAAEAATRAVAQPVAGTILTVADAAAAAAERESEQPGGDALTVARAAQAAAAEALAGTPDQLDVLAEAGVVDAGGQALVLLIDVLVEVLGGPPAVPLVAAAVPAPGPLTPHAPAPTELQYEVMYALRGADPDALADLRRGLSGLGTSVVVVGDATVAQVHVHLHDAGAAVEAGLRCGVPSRLRITALPVEPRTATRTVLAVVAGPGLGDTVRSHGGTAVQPADRHVTAAELAAALDATDGDVVLLPNDMESLEIAGHLAAERRGPERRVAVIPTVAQIQGLAALAVHEPTADFDSAVVAMSTAAGHARHGAVTVAESPAMTMAGRCEVGDVLGLVDGDFVEIGSSLTEVAWRVVQRLLAAGGGELLTVVTGRDAEGALVEELQTRLGPRTPLDVEVVEGGQPRYPLLLGLE